MRRVRLLSAFIGALACAATPVAHAADRCAPTLRLIDVHSIPPSTRVDDNLFGGISGLDYDARTREWLLLSDDRAEHGPARFFRAHLDFDAHRLVKVTLRSAQYLRHLISTSAERSSEWIDAESIRIDQRRRELVIASEGSAQRQSGSWIRRANLAGRWLGEIRLPPTFDTAVKPRGARPNRSFEGLAFGSGDRSLWIALESPLLQDGEPPSVQQGADVRLTRMQWPHGDIAQYVYRTDPVHAHAIDESADNGISEILELRENELLVLERSGVKAADGSFRFHTRLYCADTPGATDVASFDQLAGRTYTSMTKRLVFDFDRLEGITVDNLEAMAWGPDFGDGRRSLVLASDNNFFVNVPTQLLVFEVLP